MNSAYKLLLAGLSCLILFKSCTNHDIEDPSIVDATDSSLFAEIEQSGYTYYQNGDMISAASQSPHGPFRLRFNSIALSALDNAGVLPPNGRFPSGSIVVKETYRNSNFDVFAVMKKAPTDNNAGNGWLWAEYQINGGIAVSLQEKGGRCINCHTETPNRDLVRTFDLH